MLPSLQRVVSVRQTSRAATALPLELQQHVFSYLEPKSFYAARKTCRWWQFAATAAVPLAKQLRRMPILPLADAASSTPRELQDLYAEATRTLMIGVHAERAYDTPGSLTKAKKLGIHSNPRVVATLDGNRTVVLDGRSIELYDTSGDERILISQRTINDLKETVGNGPWLKVQPNDSNELSLSPDGRLLAIAQERTIQIYDLLDTPDSFTVNEYLSSATGHYISGLEFEQNHHLLRVQLSGKGTVLYLGSPPSSDSEIATITHWKSKVGLRNTFVDSALLCLPTSSDSDSTFPSRISGIQLLGPFHNGYLFASQLHASTSASCYILFHLSPSSTTPILLARLESFLSSWDYTLYTAASEIGGMGLWENMPSAHEHDARFAVGMSKGEEEDGWLAVVEKDKKRIRPRALSQVFVYKVPARETLRRTIEQAERERTRTVKEKFLERLEGQQDEEEEEEEQLKRVKYTVPRLPLCLTTLQGEVTQLSIQMDDISVDKERRAIVVASTAETTRTWVLHEY
ncbi:hypothetical protein TI39_contig307g00006 [Zymoseptoria brevis]|uniref:F-box domain-containing protein n=1 Tax=Zymoseptoria brevis TaxID=1047168 RepID=A0A0F4GTX1_9PEZI|nr:hypothetical protein TI39_contig307g00006 [Zymoseptoria brevis]